MVILGMGGNLGDTLRHFDNALAALTKGGFIVERVSSPYRNPAVGCEEGAPEFTNVAVVGRWERTPEELLELLQGIEEQEGRPHEHPHWHSRTLDIDIIDCNGVLCDTSELTLPHPRWRERDFVKIPMEELGVVYDEAEGVFRMGRMKVLLASGSPQRRAILEELGIAYQAVAMDVDETALESPADTVRENARRKLVAARKMALRGQAVIAADTIVWADGRGLGKPGTPECAREYLRRLSGKTVQAYSGVAVGLAGDGKECVCVQTATMRFRAIEEREIEWYVSTGEPLERAGAIGISHYGEIFITGIEGEYSCIAGLPKSALLHALSQSPELASAALPVAALPVNDF